MKILDIHFPISPLLFQLAARLELPALRRALKPALRTITEKQSPQNPGNKVSKLSASPEREKNTETPRRGVRAEPRKTLFHLRAPSARSVKLVADFTDWEKYPLDMIQCDEGNWFAIVPLTPGNYSYRFIVDGEWFNDPRAAATSPNPFGTSNTIVQIT